MAIGSIRELIPETGRATLSANGSGRPATFRACTTSPTAPPYISHLICRFWAGFDRWTYRYIWANAALATNASAAPLYIGEGQLKKLYGEDQKRLDAPIITATAIAS